MKLTRRPVRLIPFTWELGRDCAHFALPIHTVSEANQRERWEARHRRRAKQRADVRTLLIGASKSASPGSVLPSLPVTVTLTRVVPSRRSLLDSDNAVSACKAVRDSLADLLGVDDADPRVEWHHAQSIGTGYGVLVDVRARAEGAAA